MKIKVSFENKSMKKLFIFILLFVADKGEL